MKKYKNIIVYAVIALLCIAAFAGYFITRKSSDSTVAASSTASTTATAGKTEAQKQEHIKAVMEKSVAVPSPNPVVGIGRGTDHAKVTRDAIENAGGLKDIVKKGDVVLIKPNLCTNAMPDTPTTTDYRVTAEVVKIVKELGASRVIIAEGGFQGNVFDETGMSQNKYNTIQGVEFFDFNSCKEKDCYQLKTKDSLLGKELYIPKIYMDADVVITVPKLKTHFIPEAVVTLSLKNSFGVPPAPLYGGLGDKIGLHDLGMVESIMELNKIRKPDFSVIDGIIGGQGEGPVNNTSVNSNIVLAGKDIVAVDTVALNFMGFQLDQVWHVKKAVDLNLGIGDINKITVKGADLKSIIMNFESSFKPINN